MAQALHEVLPEAMDAFQPELVMYNAGVDVAAGDSLGLMALTDAGIRDRDRFVLQACAQRRVSRTWRALLLVRLESLHLAHMQRAAPSTIAPPYPCF